MKIINLTPHRVVLFLNDGSTIVFPEAGEEKARVERKQTYCGTYTGIPFYHIAWGETQGLPDPEPGTLYIVSTIVFEAEVENGRVDLIVPINTKRDAYGQVIGNRSFKTALPNAVALDSYLHGLTSPSGR